MILLLAVLFLIVFEAAHEGLKSRTLHVVSEWVEFVYLAVITSVVIMWVLGIRFEKSSVSFAEAIIGYVFVRFALFDFIWNISAGRNMLYIGKTKSYDLFVSWFVKRWGVNIWFVRLVFLVVGLSLLI